MTNRPTTTGRCLCGDIRYEYRTAPTSTLYCHCESCRRHTSAPIVAFVRVRKAAFRFTSGEPVAYASSPGVWRTHCGRCGSPIAYEVDDLPDEIDLYTATLNDPAAVEAAPTHHVHAGEQLPWIETADLLPRYQREREGAAPLRHGPRQRAAMTTGCNEFLAQVGIGLPVHGGSTLR
jgi:hypothetical protein